MSSPASRRSLSTADWPIDPALENSQLSQPSPPPPSSPPRRLTRSSQAASQASQATQASQNEKEDELMEVDPEAGPSRPRKATQSNSQRSNRRRRRSSSPEDDGADVINPPQPKRKKTAQELQRSYAQGWETRRVNIWAERVLPTYSTGLDADYSDLPPDFLLDSISQHAGRYFSDRGLMKNPKRSWHRRTSVKPNKKRRMLEQGGAIARVLRESGIQPSRLSIDTTAERRGEEQRMEEVEGGGEGEEGERDDESDRVLRPRSAGSTPQPAAKEGEGSGSDTDASEDAYNPNKDPEANAESDDEPTTNSSNHKTTTKSTATKQVVVVAPAARTQQLRDEATKRPKKRGPYIRRDMRNAIHGAGLLALGVLVEEMIRAQLGQAGYAPRVRDRRASTAVESDVEPISDPE